jgi:hypothetical protein
MREPEGSIENTARRSSVTYAKINTPIRNSTLSAGANTQNLINVN